MVGVLMAKGILLLFEPSPNHSFIPVASDIIFQKWETRDKSKLSSPTASDSTTVFWVDSDDSNIRISNATNMTPRFTSGAISGETLHILLCNMGEWEASIAIDESSLHGLDNLKPNTIDECGLFGLNFLLPMD